MAKSSVYQVVIKDLEVSIKKIGPSAKAYKKASEKVILRERDAIERYRDATKKGLPANGSWHFASLENAKSFALLQLKTIEQSVEDNLDRIQGYEG